MVIDFGIDSHSSLWASCSSSQDGEFNYIFIPGGQHLHPAALFSASTGQAAEKIELSPLSTLPASDLVNLT